MLPSQTQRHLLLSYHSINQEQTIYTITAVEVGISRYYLK